MVDQRPGERDPLLFAARQLAGHRTLAALQAQFGEQLGTGLASGLGGGAGEQGGQFDVVGDGEVGDQVEELEDDADAAAPENRPAGLAVLVDPLTAQPQLPAVGPLEAADQVQQRGLAGSRRPGDRDELARVDGQVHPAHGVDRRAFAVVRLGQALGTDDGHDRSGGGGVAHSSSS